MARYFYFMMTFAGTGMFQIFVGVLLLAAQNASSYAMLTSEVNTDTETVDAVRIIAGWYEITCLGVAAVVFTRWHLSQDSSRFRCVVLCDGRRLRSGQRAYSYTCTLYISADPIVSTGPVPIPALGTSSCARAFIAQQFDRIEW